MATTDDLMQNVFQNFLSAYHQSPGSTATNMIAFEAVGLSPGLVPSAPDGSVRALEYVSTLADSLPDVSAGVYQRTMRTISVTYEDMLNASQVSSTEATSTFNAAKQNAKESFDNFTLGSENGPGTYKPAYASPENWYDPSQQTNWLQYSYSTEAPPPPPPPVTLSHPPLRMMAQVAPWRVTMAPMVYAPTPVAPQPVAANTEATHVNPAVLHLNPVNERWLPPPGQLQPTPQPAPQPTPQPALQPQFSMSFDYCIVGISRPWFSEDFLAAPGWYVPGAHQGDYSTGPSAATAAPSPAASASPGSTTPASTAVPGAFSQIPTAFIAVKNLLINSIGIDTASPGSPPILAFGPFSLAHASGTANSLSDTGIQLIAWICSAQPVLPPDTDPALLPPPATTVVQTAVNVLESLFGGSGNGSN